ncbi:phage tail assembly protein [Desulfuromonas thiophila]|uniref:phage tail assembly protein n=1 Tax=Desulfuromonas thiophila TaxID=57664 RepID=UPI0029F5BFAD|nr:phage tail assembly protein [Desulfuromonas thiophila]
MENRLKLAQPVVVAGNETTELTMRRMKVRDRLVVEKLGGSDIEKEVQLIANLCDVSRAVIEELDMQDYLRLQERYTSFLS